VLLQLRLAKVSELIHNSPGFQNLESASVVVHFARIIDVVRLLHSEPRSFAADATGFCAVPLYHVTFAAIRSSQIMTLKPGTRRTSKTRRWCRARSWRSAA